MATRRIGSAVPAALLLLVCVSLAPGQTVPAAKIVNVNGKASIRRQGRGPWLAAVTSARKRLNGGDHVQVGPRSSVIIDVGGVTTKLGPGSWARIRPRGGQRTTAGPSKLDLLAGRALVWIMGRRSFQVSTAGATAATGGTKFVIEVAPGDLTTLSVLEGSLTFYNDLGSVSVTAGQESQATPTTAPTRPMAVDVSGYIQWEASLQNTPLGLEVRYNAGESADRLNELAEEARREAEGSPDDVDAQLRAGQALHDTGELEEAEKAFGRVLELAPANAEARVGLGHTLLEAGDLEGAEAAFAEATGTAESALGTAAARLSRGDTEGAREFVDQALAMDADSADAHTLLGVLEAREGNGEAAEAALRRAIELDPTAYLAQGHLALVLLAAGKADEALASAERASELAPGSALAHESLGTAAFLTGDPDTARREADAALAADADSAGTHLLLSNLLVAEGNLAGGLREAELAIALDPQLAPAYHAAGMIALAQNDLHQAELAFERALELRPDLAAARTGVGLTYSRQGKLAKALDQQKAAIALDAGLAASHNNLGAIYLAEGRLDEAVGAFERALELQPDLALAHANLAIARLDQNRFADAVREVELALDHGENSARAHTTAARIYLEQGRTNQAWAALRKAQALDPSYGLGRLHFAEVYLRQGRSRDARREQLEGIISQPGSILETRSYARTEVRLEAGSPHRGRIRLDGVADDGNTPFFVSGEHVTGDWGRPHTRFRRTSALAVLGHQHDIGKTAAMVVSLEKEQRDRPGMALAGGLPTDVDYRSYFTGGEGLFLTRFPTDPDGRITIKLGYQNASLQGRNPDSLLGIDPKPFRELDVRVTGPVAEVRLDRTLGQRDSITAGAAWASENRTVAGLAGVAGTPPTFTPFRNRDERNVLSLYLEHEHRLGEDTELMLGGRMAVSDNTSPVFRPKAALRHHLSEKSTIIALTNPVLRDDISDLAPVERFSLGDGLSPLDLTDGGYSQSYELQFEHRPTRDSVIRVSGFDRRLRNLIVDLEDPAWSPRVGIALLDTAEFRGAELEWEQRLTDSLTASAWARYTDSENRDAGGLGIPYRPEFSSRAGLEYTGRSGLRARANWLRVGNRYGDIANAAKLGSYDVVDLWAAYQVDLQTDVFLTVDDVFDEGAAFWQGYPSRGRTVRGGVEFRF